MKQITLQFLLFFLCVSSCWEMAAQTVITTPAIASQYCLGGSGADDLMFAKVMPTGEYIYIGNTTSTNGNVIGNHGGKDIWFVKVNNTGTILAQACYGGSNNDEVVTVTELSNSEFLLKGIVRSGNGNVVGFSGGVQDDWLLKVDANGAIVWQQCAAANSPINALSNNYFLVAGQTNNVNANNYHGGIDAWVKIVELSTGNVLVNKCYGGTGDDRLLKGYEENGNFILGGYTNSTNGDIVGQHGRNDIWTLKIDINGNILNQKVLGGSEQEFFHDFYKTSFGNYVISASTSSSNGDISTLDPVNYALIPNTVSISDTLFDNWSLMLDNNLTLLWERTLGGFPSIVPDACCGGTCCGNTGYDFFSSFTQSLPATDGGVWIVGQVEKGDANTWPGYDFYGTVLKLSPLGIVQQYIGAQGWNIYDPTYDSYVFDYYLTNNSSIVTDLSTQQICPTCGWTTTDNANEINASGLVTSCQSTTTFSQGYTTTSSGVCPSSAPISPPYYASSSLAPYSLQNDTCSSNTYTYRSDNGNYSYSSSQLIISDNLGASQSLGFGNPARIHALDCYSNGVYMLASGTNTTPLMVGNHGLSDFWLAQIESPNNLYGGKLWKDNNANGTFNTGDQLMANRIFKVSLNSSTTPYYIPTDSMGRYRIATGRDTLTALLTNPPLYHSYAPSQFTHIFATNGNTDTLNDVVLTPIPNISDMYASLTAINNPQPGFDTDYNLTYKNKGTVAKTGSVRMTWNASDQTFVSANPIPDTLTTSYAAWKYTNMPSLANASINIKLNTTSFNLGANIQNIANIYPVAGDQMPVDNQDTSNIILTGSYDPNNITVSDTLIDSTYMATNGYVTYTIRFQNTGTAAAQNILVEAVAGWWNGQIDISSFEPVAQSHPYSLIAPKSAGQTNLRFKFSNIQLPFTGAASHGFVKFRVKLKHFSRCQLVMANAKIYFDNNPAIITNTVQTRHALPKPVITANGPTTFCTGGGANVVLAAPAGMQTYTWSFNNSHYPTLTVTSPIGATTLHYLTVKKQAGCYATSLPFSVTVNALPIATITNTGPLTFCDAQANTTLNANVVAGYNYTWNLNGTAIGGATNTTYSPTQSGVYNYTVVDSNGCTKNSATKTITVNPSPTVAITANGNTTNCVGDTLLLTSTATSGVTYQWQKNNANLSGGTNPNLNATTTGNYRLIVATAASCKDTSTVITSTFAPLPVVTLTNTGPLTFCDAQANTTLNANLVAGYDYTWNLNGAAIPGANNPAYLPLQTGTYTFTVVDSNGCSKTSLAKSVTVNPSPTVAIAASGNITNCVGDTLLLTSTATSGVTYQWQKNNANLSGGTNPNLNATTTGNYRLIVATTTNCKDTSIIIASTFSTIPTANISNVGALTFCEGGSVTLNVSTGTNYTYTWNESGLAINGANNSSYIATQSGTYTATVNNNGCEKTSLAKVVTVNPLPAMPIISQSGNTLSSTSTSGNQWYLNGNVISSATGVNYSATQSGTYTVNVTDGNGCSSISDPYTFIYVGLNDSYLVQSLQVYPNPASQNLTISFEKTSKKATSILLTNTLGQIVYEKNIAEIGNIEMTIDVANFSEGVYRLELKGEEGQASKNIVVLKR